MSTSVQPSQVPAEQYQIDDSIKKLKSLSGRTLIEIDQGKNSPHLIKVLTFTDIIKWVLGIQKSTVVKKQELRKIFDVIKQDSRPSSIKLGALIVMKLRQVMAASNLFDQKTPIGKQVSLEEATRTTLLDADYKAKLVSFFTELYAKDPDFQKLGTIKHNEESCDFLLKSKALTGNKDNLKKYVEQCLIHGKKENLKPFENSAYVKNIKATLQLHGKLKTLEKKLQKEMQALNKRYEKAAKEVLPQLQMLDLTQEEIHRELRKIPEELHTEGCLKKILERIPDENMRELVKTQGIARWCLNKPKSS